MESVLVYSGPAHSKSFNVEVNMSGLIYGLVSSVIAVIVVLLLIRSVLSKEEGTDIMRKIARQIQIGASTFLRREYTYIS